MALVSGLVGVGAAVCCIVVCFLLAVVSCLLSVVCRQLFAVCCLLFAVCCLLSAVCCLLSAVCCLLSAVCCLLSTFVICSLFVRCLFTLCTLSFRSLFVLCSLSVCCRQLFASCMPAAVGRKIKYRFHAWQAPEVFSKRQPLIFSHYLCLCGSFFPHVCVAFMCVPRQYSCLRPSGRCRMKRPFSTTFSSHFHNGSISRDSVPLRHGFFRCALAAGLLCGLTPPSRFHNGSISRDSVPLRYGFFRCALAAGLLCGLMPPSHFHNGSVSRDSVPLRHGFHRGILSTGLLRGIALPSRFHNGSVFRGSVPLRHGFHRGILFTGLLRGIALPSRFHNGSVFRDSVPLRYHALEGADRSGLSPPPSRIRYKPTCPRSVPRRPCPGTPSGRCRRKCCLPVTFSFWHVASPHSFGRGGEFPAFSDSFGRSHRAFSGSVSLVGIVKPFSL